MTHNRPDHSCLFDVAANQHGYFTAAQARACGFGWDLLTRHVQSGRYIRLRRGTYRLRDYPSSPFEEVVSAWLTVGKDSAVVSHETALDLLELSDVIPRAIHLTVPRSKRYTKAPPGAIVHTTARPLDRRDVTVRHGIRLTSPTRSILDAAEAGTGPEQIEMAIQQAVERGLADPQRMKEEAETYSRRVRRLVQGALDGLPP
jgi:predicted transcriptional regulator of viral defense system